MPISSENGNRDDHRCVNDRARKRKHFCCAWPFVYKHLRPHETNKPPGEPFVKLALTTVVRELFDFIRL
jgi:hypothetical protein